MSDVLEAPWLAGPLALLRAQHGAGRLPHAVLLCGPRGWGKQSLLRRWIAELLALPAYRADEEWVHPDLRVVKADGESDTAQIKIDQIREFADFITSTASGTRKVGVIEDAERMNSNAANALLKTLEEPVGTAHIVLISARPWALLPTIRSRLALLTVRGDPAAARQWLAGLPEQNRPAPEVLWLAGGAPVRALELQQDGSGQALLGLLDDLNALRGTGSPAAAALQSFTQRMVAVGLVNALEAWQRLIHATVAGPVAALLPAAFVSGSAAPVRALLGFADALAWSKRAASSTANPNPALLCEALLSRWALLGRA